MMASLEYFIVCRSVSQDVGTDEISLVQVIEDFFLQDGPNVLPKAVGVCSWRLTADEQQQDFQAILKVKVPGDNEGVPFPMNLAPGHQRHRAIMGVVEIPLNEAGHLEFEVLLNGRHAATHMVTVHPKGVRQTDEAASLLREPSK